MAMLKGLLVSVFLTEQGYYCLRHLFLSFCRRSKIMLDVFCIVSTFSTLMSLLAFY